MRVRLGDLDGADVETRLSGARARVELGDMKAAVDRLKQYAGELQEKGKHDDALRLLTEGARLDPDDASVRQLLVHAYLSRGDLKTASEFAKTADELQHLAAELFRAGPG